VIDPVGWLIFKTGQSNPNHPPTRPNSTCPLRTLFFTRTARGSSLAHKANAVQGIVTRQASYLIGDFVFSAEGACPSPYFDYAIDITL
jgi:hypothetical protein